MSALEKKRRAAAAALGWLPRNTTIGMGTGSTVNCLIEALAGNSLGLKAVASSEGTSARLTAVGAGICAGAGSMTLTSDLAPASAFMTCENSFAGRSR